MNLLEMLMGSSQAREGFKDFLNRFEDGPPSEGYEDQEVLDRYGEVAHKVSSSDYQQAARDAFGRLSQADREEFGRMLAGQAQSRGLTFPGSPQVRDRASEIWTGFRIPRVRSISNRDYFATFWVDSPEGGTQQFLPEAKYET